jgi:hypothetical protein
MGLQAPPTESIDSVKELILWVNENQRTRTHRDKRDKKHRKRKSDETSELPPPPPPQQPPPPPLVPSPEEILNMQSMHLHNLLFHKRQIEAAIEEANSQFIAMRIEAPQDMASKRIVYMIMDDGKPGVMEMSPGDVFTFDDIQASTFHAKKQNKLPFPPEVLMPRGTTLVGLEGKAVGFQPVLLISSANLV